MGDSLATFSSGIDDEAKAIRKMLPSELRSRVHEGAEHVGRCFGDVCKMLFRNKQHMRGRLGICVCKRETLIVFVQQHNRDRVSGDLAKETVDHPRIVTFYPPACEGYLGGWSLSKYFGFSPAVHGL